MRIWIHIDGAQQGPFEPESLPLDKINEDTPMWHEGLAGWTRAADIPVVASLLPHDECDSDSDNAAAPAAESAADLSDRPQDKCPANYLVWSILLTLLCCNPIGIIPIIIGSGVRTRWNAQQYDSARRQSEITAWWLMITIVTCLMLIPMGMLLKSM